MTSTPKRFERHAMIDWFDQNEVLSCAVLVVGAGAIGNEVLKNLCLLGVGRIHIVDFDLIEEHNLTRTVLFNESDIGKGKAQTAAAACRKLSSTSIITSQEGPLWQTISISGLSAFDAVLCCVDNLEARIQLNTLCRLARLPLINGAIDSRRFSVQYFPYTAGTDAACYECWLPPSAYEAVQRRYSCGWLKKRSYEEKKIPTTTITASAAGAQMTSVFLQSLCGHPDHPKGAIHYTMDTVTMCGGALQIEQSPTCPSCLAYAQDVKIYSAKRSQSRVGLNMAPSQTKIPIHLSDPILISAKCTECEVEEEILDLANKYDDSLAFCFKCRKPSRNLRIVETLTQDELVNLFKDRPLPVKYIEFKAGKQQIIVELED